MSAVRLAGVLVLGVLATACAGSKACPSVLPLVSENSISDLEKLRAVFERNGFSSRWVKVDKAIAVTHDEMPGKVLMDLQPKRKLLRLVKVYGMNPDAGLDETLLRKVNEINRLGVVKLFVEGDGLWAEMFIAYRDGVPEQNLMVTTRNFSRLASQAARGVAEYLK